MRERAGVIQKGVNRRSAKMNPVLRGLLVVALIYVAGNMIATIVQLQMQIREKQAELGTLQEKISVQSVKNEELNSILNAEIDAEYVEQVARDLGYGTVGELVYDNITDY